MCLPVQSIILPSVSSVLKVGFSSKKMIFPFSKPMVAFCNTLPLPTCMVACVKYTDFVCAGAGVGTSDCVYANSGTHIIRIIRIRFDMFFMQLILLFNPTISFLMMVLSFTTVVHLLWFGRGFLGGSTTLFLIQHFLNQARAFRFYFGTFF